MYINRVIPVKKALQHKSVLLLGPRRTGKSTFIREEIKADRVYNLLLSDQFLELSNRPSLIREQLTGNEKIIVIDEIQKLPILMDEVHNMIEERGIRFLLTGSSARKLKRTYTSLMAGRAKTMLLLPFTSSELKKPNIKKILSYGSLPPVYLAKDPWDELRSYVGDYLKEEILAEALVRKMDHFSRFLHTATLWNGELINFENIGSDAQVPSRTIREYYGILEDTLIGKMLHPLKTKGKRKAISTAKFYFFDIGVVNALIGQKSIPEDTKQYGDAFEHFIYLEIKAFLQYSQSDMSMNFWRTYSGNEVDFIIGNQIAIEAKATKLVQEKHLKGIESLSTEISLSRRIIVSRDKQKRTLNGIEIFPITNFLHELWSGNII